MIFGEVALVDKNVSGSDFILDETSESTFKNNILSLQLLKLLRGFFSLLGSGTKFLLVLLYLKDDVLLFFQSAQFVISLAGGKHFLILQDW